MSKISLEKAWQNKKGSEAEVASQQLTVSQLTSQLGDASSALTSAQSDDARNETTLESVAGAIPPNSVAQTSDGTVVFSIAGKIYESTLVPADQVTLDDGNPDPGPAPPVPQPEPDPAPQPAPDPVPNPDAPPDPEPAVVA